MRSIFLLCSLAVFLTAGVTYTASAPHAGVGPQDDYPSTPEGWAKRYEEDARKCQQEAYDLHSEIQDVRKMVVESNGEPMFVWRMVTLQNEYKSACFWYHVWMEHAGRKRAEVPTPTPTPTPVTTSPGDPQRKPTPSSGTGEMPVWPRDMNDRYVRFTREQERKLRELRDEKNKLIKEINDFIKTAKPRPPKRGFKVESDSTSGLFILNFTTPEGVVRVNLPADMRSGDTISGSVVVEPNGQTEEERARNRKALNGYQLMIANQKAEEMGQKNQPRPTFGGPFGSSPDEAMWTFHTMWDPGPCTLSLTGVASGEEMARTTIPVSAAESKATRPQTPTQNDFKLPTTGQNGRSIEIKGPFDGNLRTTDLKVSGQPVTKLAESPRGCVFKSPEQVFGPAEITLKENNIEAKGPYRNLGVRLSAPKTSLLKGETTNVTIEISGLQGIQKDVPLHLESKGVINMAGGNYQYLSIRPQDVTPDGRYTTTRAITGQQTGAFGVTCTVFQRQIPIWLAENANVNGFRVKKNGNSFLLSIENVKDPLKGEPLEGTYEVDYGCLTSTKLSRALASFKKGNAEAQFLCPESTDPSRKPPNVLEPRRYEIGVRFEW